MTARYLVITEGQEPANAQPLVATSDPRLVAAALRAMFGTLQPPEVRALRRRGEHVGRAHTAAAARETR